MANEATKELYQALGRIPQLELDLEAKAEEILELKAEVLKLESQLEEAKDWIAHLEADNSDLLDGNDNKFLFRSNASVEFKRTMEGGRRVKIRIRGRSYTARCEQGEVEKDRTLRRACAEARRVTGWRTSG
jgi:chromosome segregation ATPase